MSGGVNMDIAKKVEELKALEMKMYAYNYASSTIYVDSATVAPKDTSEGRGRALAVLSEESYKLIAGDYTRELINDLKSVYDELDDQTKREVHLLSESIDKLSRVPMDEYIAHSVLVNEAQDVWRNAKENNDFESFRPYLEKLVDTARRFAGYYDPTKAPYDALLHEYEKGASMEMLDKFFGRVKDALVPLIEKVCAAKQPDDSFLFKHYPKADQQKFTDYLMDVMGLDRGHCAVGETEHPFTSELNKWDVRITTHYYEDNLASSMYSVIHEGGHALYELGGADELQYTVCSGGTSLGIHESQSRFYENIIGRSEAFINAIFPKLCELFPEQLEGVTAHDFYLAVNRGQPSLIRTEADELTYCMHVIIRYELEKKLISGELAVKDLPAEWNRMYKEYLGVDVPDDTRGVLQDSHWSGGALGYFPSYALGSAYGAQMVKEMEKEIDIDECVSRGDLSPVTAWLGEKVHRHGSMLDPADIMKQFGGFDPECFIEYITKKYTALYEL